MERKTPIGVVFTLRNMPLSHDMFLSVKVLVKLISPSKQTPSHTYGAIVGTHIK